MKREAENTRARGPAWARLQKPQQTSRFHFCQLCGINIVPFSLENPFTNPGLTYSTSPCLRLYLWLFPFSPLSPLDLRLVCAVIRLYLLLHPHNHLPVWAPEWLHNSFPVCCALTGNFRNISPVGFKDSVLFMSSLLLLCLFTTPWPPVLATWKMLMSGTSNATAHMWQRTTLLLRNFVQFIRRNSQCLFHYK